MRGFGGILIVLVISLLVYKYYFTGGQSGAAATPAAIQSIDIIGVKNDLLAIAQAERIYQAQHSSYGSLDDLVSSGAMALKKTGRAGYTYEAETSDNSFRVVARCTNSEGCTNFAIDQSMEITSVQ